MRNWWIKLGCFLTGYNYRLLMSCSEGSKKAVKKYTSALLIIMILWFLIGFLFSKEYLKLPLIGSVIAGLILMVIIVQIERQIILGSKNKWTVAFRIVLGLVMAILGSVIVDQIIFKEDISKQKKFTVNEEVELILPNKIKEINSQVGKLDTIIGLKEIEREIIFNDITLNPTIKMPTSSVSRVPKKIIRKEIINGILIEREVDTVYSERSYTSTSIQNPKYELIPELDNQIKELRNQKNEFSKQIIDVRKNLEVELLASKGFLDELEVMFGILTSSSISLIIWILWFVFFLIIELFVLASKILDSENDYDKMIKHQINVRMQAISNLSVSE